MMTGQGHVGSPEYRTASGMVGTDEGAAMRYVTDHAAKGMPRAIAAGNARTLASLSYAGDSHEGSVLTTRFLFDVREAPTVAKGFNRLFLDTMADLGRWTYDEAGQRPREVFRDKVFSMFGTSRLERADAIFDFHLMTAFLMRNAKSDEQRGVILQGFEARGGQERLLNQVLEWVNGAAARKKERIASSPLNQALNQMDFSSVRAARPLTRGEAERLAAEWSKKFKASISVDWENPAIGMSVSPSRPVSIPRGLIEYPGITADGLALLVSHEMAHVRGIMDEAAADDYAARHGLRLLWGDAAFAKGIPERAFKAAYSVLLKWSQLADNAFSVVTAEPVRLVNERGTEYLSLQSRWDVFREGFMGRPTSVMRN
ncbi:MAG: hypothetical protein K1X64_04525 [Myxococcaceae bacterium]|nr:hypothetical protein [Myxococcaceae bacterium]